MLVRLCRIRGGKAGVARANVPNVNEAAGGGGELVEGQRVRLVHVSVASIRMVVRTRACRLGVGKEVNATGSVYERYWDHCRIPRPQRAKPPALCHTRVHGRPGGKDVEEGARPATLHNKAIVDVRAADEHSNANIGP